MSERYYSYIDPTVGLGSQTISDQQANGEFYGVRNSVDIVARNIQATGNFIGALVADNTTFLNLNVTGIATVTEMQVGFVSSTDLLVTGISTVGVVTGGTYYGDGSNLTGIAASSLSVDGQTIVDISLSPDLAFVNGRLGIGSTTPTSALDVVNTKTVGEKLQTWIGDQHSLDVENFSSGDYSIVNSATGNGIKIYNSTSGVEILYNNSPLISCTDNFVDVSGSFLASGITSSIFGTGTQQIILDPAGPGPQFHIKTSNGEHDGILLDMDDDQGSNNFYAINVRLSDSPQNHTDNTNTKFLVNAEGNVLLNYGTNLDTGYWLDVNGTGRFTGDLTVSTNIYSNGNRVLTTGDEGTGNGLDADTLDSYHATDFATSSQGTLADSAIQSGDNISVLNNDSGYITGVSTFSGDYSDLTNTPAIPTNNNELTNGAGYITASDSAIPTNNNQLTNGAGYVTSTGTVALAEGLTGTPNITVNDVTSSSVISSSYTANSNIIIQPSGSTQGRTVSILGGDDDDGVGGNIFIGEGGSGGHIYFRSNGGEDSYRFAKSGQNAIEGFLNFNNLTADRKFHFPDQAGTLFLSGGNLSELNNDVGFATAGVSPWTRDGTDIYYNGGNVGIQQDAPQGLLHIGNTNRTLSTTVDTELLQLRLQADTSNADKLDFFVRRKETGSAWTSAFQRIQRIVDTSPMGFIQFGRNNVDPISFGNNESVFITMDNTGSLGIGVTDPSSSLEVLSTSASKPAIIVKNSGTLADDPIIQRWVGDSNSLELRNYADGDYELMNTQQNNGIRIYDGTAGVELLYNGSEALKCDSGGVKANGSRVLTVADEGSGNGIDADTVDGIQASSFVRGDGVDNGSIFIEVADADYVVRDSTDTIINFIWRDHSEGKLFLGNSAAIPTTRADLVTGDGDSYWHAGNDGTGSGLDADTLDGQEGSYYATAAQGALADTAIQPNDDASLNTLTLANLEKGDLSVDGQLSFDSSQGLIIYRTQQGTNDATTVLDGANVDAGTGINITNLGAGSESTTPFTFSIDSTVLTTSGGSLTDGSSFTLPGYHDDKLIIGISGSTNTIGFTSSTTYGDLNGDAMLFRMGNDGDGGYLWRQTNQTNSQGNMSLSNEGRLTVARSIDVGTGVDDTGSAGYPLFVQNSLEDTGGNSASIVGFIDANFTGSTTFTSNRTHTGLRVDADSDVTGHTTTDGSRLTNYSIYATCNSSTGYFANYGVRSLSRTDLQPTGSNAQSTYGFYGQAQVYNTNGTGANSNTYGGMFIGQQGGTDTVGLVVGVYGKANLTTNGANKSQTLLAGVIGEAEIDEETVNAAYSFYGIIDRDGGTVTNGILYGGSNGTEFNNATTDSWQGTIGTKWGINIHGSDKNYLDGETTLYSDTAATPALITENKGSLGSVPIIQRWVGDSDALELRNFSEGDYELMNTQQNNGIRIYDGTAGVELLYNGSEALKCDSNGVQISGSTVLTAADAGSYLKSDEDDSFTGTLTGISDATNPVITLQGSGPNIIRFLDNTSTTLGIDLVYRVTPHTLGFEKSVDGTTLWETDCDTGITDFSYTPTVNGTTLATTTALGDGSVTAGSADFRAGAFATFRNDGGGNAGYRINATAHTSTFIENGSAWESEFSNDSTNGDWTLYRAQGNAGETCTWEAQIRNEGDDRSMRLYCQGTERMATTGSGISVTGAVVVTTDIESTTASQGLILKSPNGTRYRVTVDNSGNLTTSAA